MAGKKKSGPEDENVYRVKHISRSAWEDGLQGLPGMPPKKPENLDDVAVDMAMTGEIPLELVREMLRKVEEEEAKRREQAASAPGHGAITPDEIEPHRGAEFAKESAPDKAEIEAAKAQMRAIKSRSRLPEPRLEKIRNPRPVELKKTKLESKPPQVPPEEPKPDEIVIEEAVETPEKPRQEKRVSSLTWMGNTLKLFFFTEEDPVLENDFWFDDIPLYHVPLRAMGRSLSRSVYYFGLRFARQPVRFARYILPYVLHPLLALWHLVRAGWLALVHVTYGRARRIWQSCGKQHQVRLAMHSKKQKPAVALKEWLTDYRNFLRAAGNFLMPLGAAAVLALVIRTVAGQTYALNVSYNNRDSIGVIANESVFLAAQASANRHISLPAQEQSAPAPEQLAAVEQNQREYPEFSLVRVRPEELTSADILTDELLTNSPNPMVSACGVYVAAADGSDRQLVATLKNSTDASAVLENIKQTKSAALNLNIKNGDTVGFVQQVELVQGFYPKDQLTDAQNLRDKLNGTKKGEKRYEVKAGDTPSGIASQNSITLEYLKQMNRGMDIEHDLKPGYSLVVSEEIGFLQVKVVRIEKRSEPVPFETIDTPNSKLFKGEVRTTVKGVPGEDQVLERVTYINGVRHGKPELISRTRAKEPVTQRRTVGTKPPYISTPQGTIRVTPSATGFIWPVPQCNRISSPYGYRRSGFHKGIDIADGNTRGKVIVAAKDGVVEMVQRGGSSYGHQVLINHGGGVRTRYAHMLSGSISVSPGEHVSQGQPIGRVGSTGNSTGPHLHFEVIINGRTQNPLNYVRRP